MTKDLDISEMSQTELFLHGEGDRWFLRNRTKNKPGKEFPEIDLVAIYLSKFLDITPEKPLKFLEIGCGYGERTFPILSKIPSIGVGVDPSLLATQDANESARAMGVKSCVDFRVGTADNLQFPDNSFDFVFFGWCLCYIDRALLNQVFDESDRVLRLPGFLAVLDFDYPYYKRNDYIHDERIKTYKQDYSRILVPRGYLQIAKVSLHDDGTLGFSSEPDKRIALTLYFNDKS